MRPSMIVGLVDAWLDRRSTVYGACAASLAIGLFFIFVWTPLPWGWKGIDDYYDLARSLARGEPFPTMDVMWGYAYFLAFFYRLFGDHPWIPLCAQVLLNACIPLMLYELVRFDLGERVASVAAVLAGLFSFNTVYASTQSSDAICTVLTVAAMVCFARGDRRKAAAWFVAAGLLLGLAWQFRPNLVLLPAFLAVLYVALRARTRAGVAHMAVFLAVFALLGVPWIVRNYRWSGLFVPASTHGAKQLWFGTLQLREYRESWLYNPRAAFEYPPLEYTSIVEMPIVITAVAPACDGVQRPAIELVYWTNRDRAPRRIAATPGGGGDVLVTLPAQPSPTAVYYYFDVSAKPESGSRAPAHGQTPTDGPSDPLTIVVNSNHLGDLDVDGHALDVFDLVRMLGHVAWGDRLDAAERLDFDRDGRVTQADVRRAAAFIVDNHAVPAQAVDPTSAISHDDTVATVRFRDGSALSVPRNWSGILTDLPMQTPVVVSLAMQALGSWRSFASLEPRATAAGGADPCLRMDEVAANRVRYRRLPHEMRRFTALAMDNIRHDPAGFAKASLLRALRVFVISGSEDRRTAYQFAGASRLYAIGRALSLVYAGLFVAGVVLARRRRLPLFTLLTPIVYVPLTICVMLINARYSMTTQPFVFAFVAVTLVTVWEAWTARAAQSR